MRLRVDREFPNLKEKIYRNVIGERFITLDGKRVQNPAYNSLPLEQFRDPRYSRAEITKQLGIGAAGMVVGLLLLSTLNGNIARDLPALLFLFQAHSIF